MKPYLLEKMARKGVDVALCHHHGAPDTQYLNGYRNGSGMNVSIENIKRFLRSKIDGHKDPEKRKAELIAYYGGPKRGASSPIRCTRPIRCSTRPWTYTSKTSTTGR